MKPFIHWRGERGEEGLLHSPIKSKEHPFLSFMPLRFCTSPLGGMF
jgi:hypothetical protein